ncbi:hypothetical protein GSI_05906 [Ganoderma sinense ZZ0214-1]|uniref:Uncharacterized protein n=1 Tax=Ganoderma sinense ZZ0214-1 TaxID=1077348 RepID=A0A2G8SC82_9APHY|nr:hypothetical protein GSI_05906 [Ganoderma sinense ZZ0214-1]
MDAASSDDRRMAGERRKYGFGAGGVKDVHDGRCPGASHNVSPATADELVRHGPVGVPCDADPSKEAIDVFNDLYE